MGIGERMRTNRRQFLALLGAGGVAGLAGCNSTGDTPSPGPRETSPDGTETPTATPTATLTPTATPTSESRRGDLWAPERDESDTFGDSVALSADGTTALVGASGDADPNGTKAGSAHVFVRSDGAWRHDGKLVPDDGDEEDLFGGAVALSADGTTALVGASEDEDPNGKNSGSAYVFARFDGGWRQEEKLAASGGDEEDAFGISVALSADGTTALVGARSNEDPGRVGAGSAYVFERSGDGWQQATRLAATEPELNGRFGISVALSADGTTALVGTIMSVDGDGSAGKAYLFEHADGDWGKQGTLTAEDGDAEDWFGWTVSLSTDGTTALVGAMNDEDPNGYDDDELFGGAGSAYVFERADGTWRQQTKLAADDGDASDNFGRSIALAGDGSTALIGAPYDEDPSGDSGGSAYLFRRSDGDWRQVEKLAASDGAPGDVVGWAVALSESGSVGLVGAPGADIGAKNTGTVYVFE
jgi:hypothetical protein